MNPIASFFRFVSNILNGAETAVIDFISVFVPWTVPVIPAYLTFDHTSKQMDFPSWVAATAAFVVEALGLASVATAVRFWKHNQKYKDDKNRAPFWIAASVYVFYLVVVLSVNVILEYVASTRTATVIWAIALFSTLSFPAGLLIAIRAQYIHVLEEIEERKAERRGTKGGTSEPIPNQRQPRQKHASDFQPQIVALLDEQFAKDGTVLPPKAITAKLKLDHNNSKGYVSTLTKKWKQDKGVNDPFTF